MEDAQLDLVHAQSLARPQGRDRNP
jgi:hypothetical protein